MSTHRRALHSRTQNQILEAILSLPEGAEVELRAPVFKVYGEELDFVFTEVRKKGCRQLIVDGSASIWRTIWNWTIRSAI